MGEDGGGGQPGKQHVQEQADQGGQLPEDGQVEHMPVLEGQQEQGAEGEREEQGAGGSPVEQHLEQTAGQGSLSSIQKTPG